MIKMVYYKLIVTFIKKYIKREDIMLVNVISYSLF